MRRAITQVVIRVLYYYYYTRAYYVCASFPVYGIRVFAPGARTRAADSSVTAVDDSLISLVAATT